MNLAEQLKERIKQDGCFNEDQVVTFLTEFFTKHHTASLCVSFHDHFLWERKRQPFEYHDGNYDHLVTMPKSWAMDFSSFVRKQGFKVTENRQWRTDELINIFVSLV